MMARDALSSVPWDTGRGDLEPWLLSASMHVSFQSRLLVVKMETKWKWNCSVFSLDHAMGLCLSCRASFPSHRHFCSEGYVSEASGLKTLWLFQVCAHHPWLCLGFHLWLVPFESLSTPRSPCRQPACGWLHLFFPTKVLIIQSQMIPMLRVLCSLVLFLSVESLAIPGYLSSDILKSAFLITKRVCWAPFSFFLSLWDNYDSVGLFPTVSCYFHSTEEFFSWQEEVQKEHPNSTLEILIYSHSSVEGKFNYFKIN